MPKRKAVASLAGFAGSDVDMDMESEADALPTPESNQGISGPVKKSRSKIKPAASKFSKPRAKAPSRRVSGGSAAISKKAAPKKKAALKKSPLNKEENSLNCNDTEEVNGFDAEAQQQPKEHESADELLPLKQPTKRGRKPAARSCQTEIEPSERVKPTEKDGEFEYTPTAIRQSQFLRKGPSALPKPECQPFAELRGEEIIPETQEVPMNMDTFIVDEADQEEPMPQSVFRPTGNLQTDSRARKAPFARRRAGSASDTERPAIDPMTRRKLGETTKKFENLELKYKNLREVGIKDAEATFERLKSTSEAKAKGIVFESLL